MTVPRFLPERIEGRHVLFGLLGFFGLMLLANGIFLFYAVGTFNGFDTRDAYKRGLNYNARIASEAAQAARGWQTETNYDAGTREMRIEVRNAQGREVAGLLFAGEARRPVTDKDDRKLAFQELAPGKYAARVKLETGQWVLIAEATRPGSSETLLNLKQRIWVKESR
jgi:nitrogen fixation protein FixH